MLHIVLQVVAPQLNGAHIFVGIVQVPPLAQTGSVSVPLVHVDAPQLVPIGALQVPSPAHLASWQVATLSVQVLCGSWPIGTLVQVPTEPATLQALQPLHDDAALSQHTLSTQLPVMHSLPPPQTAPWAFCAHVPAGQ